MTTSLSLRRRSVALLPALVAFVAFIRPVSAQDLDPPAPVYEPPVAAQPVAAQPTAAPDASAAPPATVRDDASDPRIAEADEARRVAAVRVLEVQANLTAVKEVVAIGLSGRESSELLREARVHAPDLVKLERSVRQHERQRAEARLHRVRLMESLRLGSPEGAERAGDEAALEARVAYISALQGLLEVERELLAKSTELVDTLDRELLWIGNADRVDSRWLQQIGEGVVWLVRGETLRDIGQSFAGRLGQTWVLSSILALVLAALVLLRPRVRKALFDLAPAVGRVSTDSFPLTLLALAYTLILSLPVAVALAFAGWLLASRSNPIAVSALGEGLVAASGVTLLLEFSRQLCRGGGLAEVHFRWNENSRRLLRVNLRWLLVVQVVATILVVACEESGTESYRTGLGRLAFLSASLGLAVFLAIVFRPATGVLSQLISRDGWAWRLRRLWYGLLVVLPTSLAVAAGAGFYYTAMELQSRLFVTGLIALSAVVVYSMLKRWLLVARRRLAVQQARQRLAQQREARAKREGGDETVTEATGEAVPELDSATVDVAAISEQTLAFARLLVAGGTLGLLFALWQDVLPALANLERIPLTAEQVDASGEVMVEPLTLFGLLMALLGTLATWIAARNLPSMIELLLSTRFRVDPGARYAVATLVRYAVIATGVVVVSGVLGIPWAKAQWIIAALGVGLGFGLQEIVANFVSGLIILLERPIRVGDTVTVGDDSGTVSKLQIRATTITDWDNKEILVPNKSFITERVVNWTLSNSVTRFIARVGVAYGTDLKLARETITTAVKNTSAILEDPAPSVLFLGFGDSSLDFEVRAFVDDLNKRLTTLHELNVEIDRLFAEVGIEIPFPQRDLHLRSDDTKAPAALAEAEPD